MQWVSQLNRVSSKKETDQNLNFLAIARKFRFLFFAAILFSLLGFAAGKTIASDITLDKVVELTNKSRMENGEKPLSVSSKLSSAAEAKADDMIAKNYFSHTAPDGTTPWHWIEKENYDYNYAGENLAMDFQSAEKMEDAWLASPTHRANILNEKYKEVGVAVKEGVIDGHQTILTVVMFGSGDKHLSSATDVKKEISNSEKEMEVKKIFPVLPNGEEKKNTDVFEQPTITSPQSGEILSESEIKIVGRAQPGETVEIFDNENLVDSAVADSNGWFSSLEKKFSEGKHNLALQSKNILTQAKTEFYVDQAKPDVAFRLYTDEYDPSRFFLEASADKNNCKLQFNGEIRYVTRESKALFAVDSEKSSAILWVSDQVGNKNFRQVNLANYYFGNDKNNISKKLAALIFSPENIFAADSGRQTIKNNLGIAMGGLNNY